MFVKIRDIKKLHSQINYSNTILNIMRRQLTKIKIDNLNL